MIVEVKNILKRYGDFVALNNFSMEIKQGEIYGLLGPNGSGKTTAINCILSLLKYDEGTVNLFGQAMNHNRYDIKSKIGYVPQDVSVFDDLKVYENIDFFCGLYVKDKSTRKQYVEEAINFVGLNDFVKSYPKKLSGGLKRRLNLACGIAHKPELLIFDEPTVAVDPQSRNSILEGIKKLNEAGATVIYTSHYMEEVEQICTNISIMDKGRILITGNKNELTQSVNIGNQLILDDISLTEAHLKALSSIPGIGRITEDNRTVVFHINDKMSAAHVLSFLETNQIFFGEMNLLTPTLNDVFLEITGKELRDSKE